jgi:hypothetical protein
VSATDVDTLLRIENISGGSGSDTIRGDFQNNILSGRGGNDTLDGGSGGIDTADYSYITSMTTGISVVLNGSTDATVSVGGAAEDIL